MLLLPSRFHVGQEGGGEREWPEGREKRREGGGREGKRKREKMGEKGREGGKERERGTCTMYSDTRIEC